MQVEEPVDQEKPFSSEESENEEEDNNDQGPNLEENLCLDNLGDFKSTSEIHEELDLIEKSNYKKSSKASPVKQQVNASQLNEGLRESATKALEEVQRQFQESSENDSGEVDEGDSESQEKLDEMVEENNVVPEVVQEEQQNNVSNNLDHDEEITPEKDSLDHAKQETSEHNESGEVDEGEEKDEGEQNEFSDENAMDEEGLDIHGKYFFINYQKRYLRMP